METVSIVNTEVRRTSRSRSKTVTPDRVLRNKHGPVTSTPIEDDNAGTTVLSTIHEATPAPDLEPVISSANENGTNLQAKLRRSTVRGKAADGHVNGSTKRTKTTVKSTTVTTRTVSEKKSAAAKEKLLESLKTSDYSSDEDEKYRVYRTYKSAGEWWNNYPKTDYTYSPRSTTRREVAPGVLNRPNLSRPGLSADRHLEHSSAPPFQSAFITGPYRPAFDADIDSDIDEVDTRTSTVTRTTTTKSTWSVMSTLTYMWILVTRMWHTTVETTYNVLGWEHIPPGYRTPVQATPLQERWWARALYLPIIWCHAANIRLVSMLNPVPDGEDRTECRRRRRFTLLALLFALCLLLAGLWLWQPGRDEALDIVTSTVTESFATVATFFHTTAAPPLPDEAIEYKPLPTVPPVMAAPAMEFDNAAYRREVTDAVLSSPQIRALLQHEGKPAEVDVESLIGRVLESRELRAWMTDHKTQVEKITTVALDSLLETQLAQERDRLAAERDRLEARVAQDQDRLEQRYRDHEAALASLRFEVDEKSRLLSEQTLTMEQLATNISRMLVQMQTLQAEQSGLHVRLASCCDEEVRGEQLARAITDVEARAKREAEEATRRLEASLESTVARHLSHLSTSPSDAAAVRAIVTELLTTYDADKTNMADHALESSGGEVVSTRCTESYQKSASFTVFGVPLWRQSNNPRTVIQPSMLPGQCWAFRGSRGYLVVKLAGLVRVTSFSLEHIPRTLAPSGNIDSAPKDFTVLGLDSVTDEDPLVLGTFTYHQNGTSLQHFTVQQKDTRPFRYIELQITSNHGNMEYTCVYRFRVHGKWVSY